MPELYTLRLFCCIPLLWFHPREKDHWLLDPVSFNYCKQHLYGKHVKLIVRAYVKIKFFFLFLEKNFFVFSEEHFFLKFFNLEKKWIGSWI